jgi:hypothetical protein
MDPWDPVVEAFRRVDVNGATGILTSLMANGVVGRKRTAQRHKRFPFITHQMNIRIDSLGDVLSR